MCIVIINSRPDMLDCWMQIEEHLGLNTLVMMNLRGTLYSDTRTVYCLTRS